MKDFGSLKMELHPDHDSKHSEVLSPSEKNPKRNGKLSLCLIGEGIHLRETAVDLCSH